MAQNRDKIEEYWKNKEEEYNEKLLYKSIAQSVTRGSPAYIGLLFLMDKHLYFEYTTSGKKSILDMLITKFKEEKKQENKFLSIPNTQITEAGIVSLRAAKSFLKDKNTNLDKVRKYINNKSSKFIDRIIFGSSLCIVTNDNYYIFQTPADKQWEQILNRTIKNPTHP